MLDEALSHPLWMTHRLGDTYVMDSKPDLWKIAYYPIFEDGRTREVYNEPLVHSLPRLDFISK